ncbi:uncharacterized protein PHACADRAFT_201780 [Phanerochaete carnosa HHB-10118-sp]|uniref:Uncharacterized protein n=1 Tax=Phanerochaete carnosa (strain HHB-10118-sp) TaxID=650164 RepID=K5UIK8_PHACS|nr:uncharacterized protein PHACADRAFT_201780 [Phanerochaete carnosa HHB-10118-sp]EKM49336.1 hypothetical protein PHACADRAFT_201780 [Phanerochaete carnosa HHB-10118-sp]
MNWDEEGNDYVKCNLLSKRVRPASAVGERREEQLAEPQLSSSSGPQPSSSPELAILSDPPQGLTQAEPCSTIPHEGSPIPAVNTPEYRSSRSPLSATKHKARRHALGRVTVARSMDELTRLEAARIEQERRRSWG